MKVIISDQPESTIQQVEYIENKNLIEKIHKDIAYLVKNKQAEFYGRSINISKNKHNKVYQIFQIDNKRILIEDHIATEIFKSLFDDDGNLREFRVEETGVNYSDASNN